MNRTQGKILSLAVAALLGTASNPEPAAAQSELDVGQAQEFLGHWLVNFESAQGSLAVEVEIADEDGKVAASVTTLQLGTQEVTDVTRSERTLTLRYEAEAQGRFIPILVALTPSGEKLDVFLDFGLGQVTAEGVGTRIER